MDTFNIGDKVQVIGTTITGTITDVHVLFQDYQNEGTYYRVEFNKPRKIEYLGTDVLARDSVYWYKELERI